MRRFGIFLIVLVMVVLNTSPRSFFAYDFVNEEAYYANLCSSIEAINNKDACSAYQIYVNGKAQMPQMS